jgi:multimeric flavodoxin WrbA
MKITILYGNARKGSTWHCMDLLKQALSQNGELEVTEFTLPRDMPSFCNGCFSCFMNGEHTCPHAASVQPIAKALLEADVIALTSSVYAMDVTGQMKAMLDHLCYLWMSHRPDPKMFNKIGVTIVTTAGAGLGHTTKTLRSSLRFWGVKRTYSYRNAVSAMRWTDVPEKKQARIRRDMNALAKRIAKAAADPGRLPAPLFRSFFFKIMTGMMKKNTWNLRDRKHWEDHEWLGKKTEKTSELRPEPRQGK